MSHYYGDIVRKLFVAGAILMAITLPFFSQDIYEPLLLSLAIIIILVAVAGLTNPRERWTAILNVVISIGSAFIFEFYAVNSYLRFGGAVNFFWVNQALALVFLSALYYSVKTLREF